MRYLFLVLLMTLTSSVLACAEIGIIDEIPNKKERQIFAEKIYERLIEIDKVIPNLKPDDKKWVDNEISSGDTLRNAQAMMSKEGMIYEIKDTFTQFIPVAKKLVDGDYKNLQHEVLFWANITHLFLQSQTWEYVAQLDIKGYVDIPKAMTEFGLGTYEYMCTNTAKTINRNIVIPYLANLLPD